SSAIRIDRRYQMFATQISSERGEHVFEYLVYPAEPARLRVVEEGKREPVTHLGPNPTVTELAAELQAWSSENAQPAPITGEDPASFIRFVSQILSADTVEPNTDVEPFARYLVRAELLPFRSSPLLGESVANLFQRFSPGTGIGAVLGYYLSPHAPLVLLTVPGGMLVGGTVYGVASALERGLHERVLKLIQPKPAPEDER
ncbi:MAG: hypothetical protein WB439_01125, partial [Acidobacteriaceae bacterium]